VLSRSRVALTEGVKVVREEEGKGQQTDTLVETCHSYVYVLEKKTRI